MRQASLRHRSLLTQIAIAGLQAKDIMGYCAMHLLLTGTIISIGLTFL